MEQERPREPVSRRVVICGAVSLPLLALTDEAAAMTRREIAKLGQQFKRLARRCRRWT
jgi:hypothetical protein